MARSSGYALVLVMVVLALLSVGLGTMFNSLAATAQGSGAMLSQRRLFYGCDGTARGLVLLARQHLREGPSSSVELGRALCAGGGGGCTVDEQGAFQLDADPLPLVRPAGMTVTGLEARALLPACTVNSDCGPGGVCSVTGGVGTCQVVASLPSGPFRGIPARQDAVLLAVEQMKGEHRCRVQQTLVVGKISPLQFVLFSALEYTDWQPTLAMAVPGRVHANGSLCVGGNQGLYLEHVTAAGDIDPLPAASCRVPKPAAKHVFIATKDAPRLDVDGNPVTVDPVGADFAKLDVDARAAAEGWKTTALSRWRSHLLDSAHDIQPLRLPVPDTVRVHHGVAADGTVMSNAKTLRFLVEPVRFRGGAEDDAVTRHLKLAEQATIRIIDGVWYVRRNDNDWPGLPIWSDHPGRYTTRDDELVPEGIAVGQAQVVVGATPRRYSPYRFNGGGGGGAAPPVISYGVTFGMSLHQRVVPGHRDGFGFGFGFGGGGGTAPAVTLRDFLAGTRTGFRNGHIQRRLAPTIPEHATSTPANILPINFDIAAFQEALASTDSGELGRRLTDLGVTFNGIVFIAASWPGSEDALAANGLAALQAQGGVQDPSQPGAPPGQQRALPDALCSDDLAGSMWSPSDFRVGVCGRGSRPNAVRLINGRHVHFPTTKDPPLAGEPLLGAGAHRLPRGLTIVTPLPLYLMGDMNLSANARELNMAAPQAQWVPLFVGGDTITVLSNGWEDRNSPWDRPVIDNVAQRRAKPTTLHIGALGGVVMTRAGVSAGGVDGFFRTLEDWAGSLLTVRGSIIVGHLPVYDRFGVVDNNPMVTVPPRLLLAHDRHLDDFARLPPGLPVFEVSAVRTWQRH